MTSASRGFSCSVVGHKLTSLMEVYVRSTVFRTVGIVRQIGSNGSIEEKSTMMAANVPISEFPTLQVSRESPQLTQK